jgi:hypothetical protein
MKVTFDTETDTFEDAIAMVRRAYGREAHGARQQAHGPRQEHAAHFANSARRPTGQQAPLPDDWTGQRLEAFARGLDKNTAEAVRYIAANAPEVSMSDTQAHVHAYAIMEMFHSGPKIGFGMFRMGHFTLPENSPLSINRVKRQYGMDRRIASILTGILGEPADVRWA